jgi:hypothetical protein
MERGVDDYSKDKSSEIDDDTFTHISPGTLAQRK